MQYPIHVPAVTVFEAMRDLDIDLAREVRDRGCPHCGGTLHSSSWQRKPRGTPFSLPDSCCTRRGLCCSRQGTLAAASLSQLQGLYGVDRRTITRWLKGFWNRLARSSVWARRRGRLPPAVRDADVPRGLFDLLFRDNGDVVGTVIRLCQLVPQL